MNKPKDRNGMNNNELRCEIAARTNPELYMDVFALVSELGRVSLLGILDAMDRDDNEGTFGPLRKPPKYW